MPRPAKYEPHPSLPDNMKQLVAECASDIINKPIRKVTGVKPLNIELSWRSVINTCHLIQLTYFVLEGHSILAQQYQLMTRLLIPKPQSTILRPHVI